MDKRTTRRKTIAILIGFMLVLLACNLGTSSGPPTLAPLIAHTPIPTLGYVAAGPTGVPGMGSTAVAPTDVEIFRLLDQVESDRLMLHINTLQNFQTRHVNSLQTSTTQGIGAARAYIADQFEAYLQSSGGNLYTFDMEFEVTFDEITTKQRNIVAVIQGTEAGAGTVIIGAHYDSIGLPFESGTTFAPGANDNGTGIAAVLELARIMSQKQYKSTIMFVLFSAEEVGRHGSKAFASWLRDNSIDVVGMINIDTIGNVHDRNLGVNDTELRIFSAGPNETSVSRRMARMVNFIGFNYGLDLDLTVQDAIDRENRYGDHFSFSELGYPAIRFINANEEKNNADPTDTIEFVEAGYLRHATQAVLAIISALSDGPRPPRNITLRDKGNGLQSLVWEPVPEAVGYIVALRRPGTLIYEQQFEVTDTTVEWDKFSRYGGIAIVAKNANGLIGPLSGEIAP
jgi:hypothetical protein